ACDISRGHDDWRTQGACDADHRRAGAGAPRSICGCGRLHRLGWPADRSRYHDSHVCDRERNCLGAGGCRNRRGLGSGVRVDRDGEQGTRRIDGNRTGACQGFAAARSCTGWRMSSELIPITGYEHITVDGANILVARAMAETTRTILEHDTLYTYASKVPDALVLQGRAPVYAIGFPRLSGRVAVRHVMRGGFVGRVLHDRFLPPTRVARELTAAFRLRLGGVPTPDVLAVGTYPAGGFFRRADVVTRFVEGS